MNMDVEWSHDFPQTLGDNLCMIGDKAAVVMSDGYVVLSDYSVEIEDSYGDSLKCVYITLEHCVDVLIDGELRTHAVGDWCAEVAVEDATVLDSGVCA